MKLFEVGLEVIVGIELSMVLKRDWYFRVPEELVCDPEAEPDVVGDPLDDSAGHSVYDVAIVVSGPITEAKASEFVVNSSPPFGSTECKRMWIRTRVQSKL